MRISLWQQFSSNHSARFTIVGRFDTPTKAEGAANELRQILSVIADWYKLHPELQKAWDTRSSRHAPAPTEPELKFSQQYEVNWSKTSIDWFRQAQISTFNEFVFLDHSHVEAYAQAFPFNVIMAKLGGNVAVNGNISRERLAGEIVKFEITARTPHEDAAEKLVREIESFLAAPRHTFYDNPRTLSLLSPWELYGTRYKGASIPNVLRVIDPNGARFHDIYTPDFVKALIPLLKADTLDDELLAKFVENVSRLADQGLDIFIDPSQIKDYLDNLFRINFYHSNYHAWGKVRCNGLQLQLSGLRFSQMADGFPALMRYLADNECTDIQYSFQESHGDNIPSASQSGSNSTTILRILELLMSFRPPKLTKRK